jgi:hypothetical protein
MIFGQNALPLMLLFYHIWAGKQQGIWTACIQRTESKDAE